MKKINNKGGKTDKNKNDRNETNYTGLILAIILVFFIVICIIIGFYFISNKKSNLTILSKKVIKEVPRGTNNLNNQLEPNPLQSNPLQPNLLQPNPLQPNLLEPNNYKFGGGNSHFDISMEKINKRIYRQLFNKNNNFYLFSFLILLIYLLDRK